MRAHIGWKNLFLLGLVAEKDRYGYELKKLLIDYYNFYGITVTTIYRSLKMAERDGYLTGKTHPGERFDLYLYTITSAGRQKLAEEIEFYLAEAESCLFKEFNTALRFRYLLEEDRIQKALIKRRQQLTSKINKMIHFLGGADPHRGSSESAQHMTEHYISERAWIDRFLAQADATQEENPRGEPALILFS
ncbi:MAG: PadR family transcriptional regulator [Firmicutes bacterium]|nr:PadR family transcriptional regulator [Bacillota bacterium]